MAYKKDQKLIRIKTKLALKKKLATVRKTRLAYPGGKPGAYTITVGAAKKTSKKRKAVKRKPAKRKVAKKRKPARRKVVRRKKPARKKKPVSRKKVLRRK